MVVEEFNIGRTQIIIHDDCIVSNEKAEEILDKCQRQKILILTKENYKYPYKAKQLEDAPAVLYYQGELKNLNHTVAIVGARRCSQEIKKKCVEQKNIYVKGQQL